MKYKESDIAKFSILLTTICNIFICITKIKYIEFIYVFIFLGLHIYYIGKKKLLNKKERNKSNKILFLGTNILIFFYIFKEPFFLLSKYKILIFLASVLVGYFSLVFIQKIKIRFSLNFFKEIIKIFLISAVIYYLPIFFFFIFFWCKLNLWIDLDFFSNVSLINFCYKWK